MLTYLYGRDAGEKSGNPIVADFFVMVRPTQDKKGMQRGTKKGLWRLSIVVMRQTDPGQFDAFASQYDEKSIRWETDDAAYEWGLSQVKASAMEQRVHPLFPRDLKIFFYRTGTHGVLWSSKDNTSEEIR